MKKYIITDSESSFCEIYNSFDECVLRIAQIDENKYNGNGFSLFGQSSYFDDDTGNEILQDYFIDSALLKDYTKPIDKGRYLTIFIQAFYIDTNEKATLN